MYNLETVVKMVVIIKGYFRRALIGTYIEFQLFNNIVRVYKMEFLEMIVVFWVAIFFLSGSTFVVKSYKRKKEIIKISNR